MVEAPVDFVGLVVTVDNLLEQILEVEVVALVAVAVAVVDNCSLLDFL